MSLKCGVSQTRLLFQDGLGLAGYGPFAGQGCQSESTAEEDQLHARVMYLSDGTNQVFLAVVDLWAASIYIQQGVLAGLRQAGVPVASHQFLMIGTHTHSGPGHFSFNSLYDAFAQAPGGSSEDVAEALTQALVTSATQAYHNAASARVGIAVVPLWGVGRNRSLPAFIKNFPAGSAWQEDWSTLIGSGLGGVGEAGLAIDPRFHALWVFEAESDKIIGTFATLGCHNAALGRNYGFYHPDLAGFAVAGVQRQAGVPWAALAQGAAGDVTAIPTGADMRAMGYPLAAERGRAVATAWAASRDLALASARADVDIEVGAHHWVPASDGLTRWDIGTPVINGCEESRSPWFNPILGEPRRLWNPLQRWTSMLGVRDEQAPKIPLKRALEVIPGHFIHDLAPAHEHPVHLVRIGAHAFFTLPGEVTSYAAQVLESALLERARAVGRPLASVSPIAITNDYCGYFTSEPEYEAQHYEGAHTLFGRRSLACLQRWLGAIMTPTGFTNDSQGPRRGHNQMSMRDFNDALISLTVIASAPLRSVAAWEAKLKSALGVP